MCVYVWFAGMANSIVYSVIVPLSEALNITVGDINAGTGYLFLLAGWGLLFFQPFALQYGKRPTYLVSMLATMALALWGPDAGSNGQWIAKNVLGGFFLAPIEALPEISVADVFFAHERGTYMGVYAFVLAGSNYFAPVYCGFVNDILGYRWVFYFQAIFCGAAFVFLFFFMEETNYDRNTVGIVDTSSRSPSFIDSPSSATAADEKDPTTEAASPQSTSLESATVSYKRKTYLQKLSLKDKSRTQRMPYRLLLQLRLVSWPVVFYAGFSYGCYLVFFNILNATASVILGAPPYGFSPALVGVSYISCVIGVVAGAVFTGVYSDWVTLKLVRRNRGVLEPEMRLWLFAITTVVLPASMILWVRARSSPSLENW